MAKVLVYEHNIETINTIHSLLKNNFSAIDMYISTYMYQNILKLMERYYPELVFINVDNNHETIFPIMDSILSLYPKTQVLLLISEEKDIQTIRSILRERNERFLFKPINESSFKYIVGKCLHEIYYYDKSITQINILNDKIDMYHQLIETFFLQDIILNNSKNSKYVNILSQKYCGGFFIVFRSEINSINLNNIALQLRRYKCHLIQHSIFKYDTCLILLSNDFIKENLKLLKADISKLCCDYSYEITEICFNLKKLSIFYRNAINKLTSLDFKKKSLICNDTASTISTFYANKIFQYFIMKNDSICISIIQFLSNYLSSLDSESKIKILFLFLSLLHEQICHYFNQTKSDFKFIENKYQTHNESLFKTLLNDFYSFNTPASSRNKNAHDQLHKIMIYTHNNYKNKNLNLQTISNNLYISTNYICKLFKKYTNFTFTDFLNDCKIEQAMLLLSSDKSIKEIAYNSGFKSTAYFDKIFKQKTNITPIEFKKLINSSYTNQWSYYNH